MKAIGIVGSPRKDGNTAYLTKQVLDGLEEKFETEMIFLKDQEINPCEACHSCIKEEKCIIEDDMQELYKKLKEASVIILSSPVHMGGITSRLRMFMERMWHLRKGQLKDKIGSFIVIGRRDLGSAVNEMEEFLTRLKLVKIPGVISYGFNKGDINKDKEALKNAQGQINQILNL
ncbi:MAG: flavodoxin family protein [Promethearchaeota archaeon]|nr:MAG: flavodoxin family protein [Candidatus Lokiarchaeota archaeon]